MTGTLRRDRANFEDRVTKLEQRRRPRQPGLSHERRKYLTDKAVREGDQEALQVLERHRPTSGACLTMPSLPLR